MNGCLHWLHCVTCETVIAFVVLWNWQLQATAATSGKKEIQTTAEWKCSLWLRQITNLLTTDKSRCFAQPSPIIVYYRTLHESRVCIKKCFELFFLVLSICLISPSARLNFVQFSSWHFCPCGYQYIGLTETSRSEDQEAI